MHLLYKDQIIFNFIEIRESYYDHHCYRTKEKEGNRMEEESAHCRARKKRRGGGARAFDEDEDINTGCGKSGRREKVGDASREGRYSTRSVRKRIQDAAAPREA